METLDWGSYTDNHMKINVGSKNAIKIEAVERAIALYPVLFSDPQTVGVDVNVELYGNPKNIKETMEGAVQRAKKAFIECDYSFGLEGGLIEVPFTKSGFMEVGACAV